ncbi:unnamed protein product [Lactuca virosa]|uniref:CMP/dCMP-type deaminase domain-containing protein n=1 Tax=Lactuca virosa TaxID=75947 RepID=A0AAU9M637_9ASTR|nr:unnamed protein product [Lactuca virosa]
MAVIAFSGASTRSSGSRPRSGDFNSRDLLLKRFLPCSPPYAIASPVKPTARDLRTPQLQLGNMNKCEENKSWEIIHIPDKPPFPLHQQPTVKVYAAVIDPKHANTLKPSSCQTSSKTRPNEGCIHLSVILCLAGESESQLDNIPQEVVEFINSYKLETFITKVCKYAPLSKEEWIEQCKIWPTSYHPPTYNIRGITGFSKEESNSVCTFMKQALDLAKCECQMMNAAIIIDPSTNEVIAEARDQVNSCSCCSINHEATSQNHDKLLLNSSATKPKLLNYGNGVSCLNPWKWSNQKSCAWHPLRHAAIVAIENSSVRDKLLFHDNEHVADNLDETNPLLKKQKIKSIHVKNEEEVVNSQSNGRPYLCTGYDIYLVWEPCAMCAMALVHQRVKCIFFAFPNKSDGALGSVHRLQGEKSLNHHYAVFRVMLPQESFDECLM